MRQESAPWISTLVVLSSASVTLYYTRRMQKKRKILCQFLNVVSQISTKFVILRRNQFFIFKNSNQRLQPPIECTTTIQTVAIKSLAKVKRHIQSEAEHSLNLFTVFMFVVSFVVEMHAPELVLICDFLLQIQISVCGALWYQKINLFVAQIAY